MGKDLSEIKLKQNSGINLRFPETKLNDNVLIVGNTIGFFGYVSNGSFVTNVGGDLKRLGWLIKALQNKVNFTIIAELEEKEYYSELFNTIKNKYKLNFKVKFYETIEPKDYFKIFDKIKDMPKFDICIMNPPYDRDLHVDFIRKCINISDTLINISPGGFINNIGIYFSKPKTHDVIKHLKEVEFISIDDSNKYFNLGKNGIKSELHIGIYKHDFNDGKPKIDENIVNIYKKIRYTCKTNLRNHFINKSKFGKYGIRIFRMHWDINTPYYDNIICNEGRAVEGIDFKTENEMNNFIKSIHSWVYEFMFNVGDNNPAHLPYLDNYENEWTDEMLYKLFNITEEDKKIIKKICNDNI